jgi:tRNA modification GTPase
LSDKHREQDETIVAVSTAPGRGGVGIVRLSGARAKEIAEQLVEVVAPLEAGRARFGKILDLRETRSGERGGGEENPANEKRATLDEAVVTYFAAPRSYTAEDVVEIAAHGAPVLMEYLVRAAIERGARVAQPGEFTERAYLRGRLDLTQAEAVRDLIEAQTLEQARVAAQQLGGGLSAKVKPAKQALVALVAELEAGIDFAEDDIPVMAAEKIRERLARVRAPLAELAGSFAYGRVLREGLTLAIVGRPNAGKSSLFNRLAERERAIVTAQPGTTRDLVTEQVSLGGVPVQLVDTAGLRASREEAEAIGIGKSREALADADLVLVVLDATQPLNDEERGLLADENLMPRAVVVQNKVDLVTEVVTNGTCAADGRGGYVATIGTSALTGEGIAELRAALLARVSGVPAEMQWAPLTNLRQKEAVDAAIGSLDAARAAVDAAVPHEMLLLDLYGVLRPLDALTGETTADDVLALIFSKFCIGK